MKVKGLSFLIALTMISFSAKAFVHQRTLYGTKFHWTNTSNITLHVNGANASGISDSTILSRATSAAAQWNSTGGGPSLSVTSASTSVAGRSDVYFSTNPLFFSSTSVIAVTESVYNETNGQIIESDIIVKDSILFSNVSTISPYIGDVLTHEMGHLLGMDHSTMPFASMFYKLSRGQNSVSYDDSLGINSLYSHYPETGEIKGTVAGGANQTAVFAADVQLISSISGRVIATTLSESDGTFSFKGIPLGDTYYIFIKPLAVETAFSSYFQTAKNDFCTGFAAYKGTFFESCDNSRKGYPQGVALSQSNSSRDVGVVTIKCNINTPLNYFTGRDSGEFVLADADRSGDSYVGYFTDG
ncbi:MAG: matrixin family metalloprotease, partial [Halobacteriovoraceae bacterium]|nr:matrixin family metalloprotease [Halobacteriovoraceae bacterium]